MKTILLLEDDKNLNRGITVTLQKEGYQVFPALLLQEAKDIFLAEHIDMVISDISLPDGDGLDFGKWVRDKSDVCFLYLTALDSEVDIISGYASGADDYMTKPFSLMVLTSKVNAMMKRIGESDELIFNAEDFVVMLHNAKVTKAGEELHLSKTEFQLLVLLLENAGKILSKEIILEKVWGNDGQFVDDNTVTVNISRLKSKLGTEHIENVRGLGYLWNGPVVKK